MKNYAPIRKVLVGALAAGLAVVAHAVGLDLGSATLNEAAVVLVGAAASYAVKDPRVRKVGEVIDDLYAEGSAAEAAHEAH